MLGREHASLCVGREPRLPVWEEPASLCVWEEERLPWVVGTPAYRPGGTGGHTIPLYMG